MMVFLGRNKMKNVAIFLKLSTNFGRGWYQNNFFSVGDHSWAPPKSLFLVIIDLGHHKKHIFGQARG